jgi:hypothetical protein
MITQFSKIFLALFIFVGIFFSCTKNEDPKPIPVDPIDTVVIVPRDTTGTEDTTTDTPDPEPEPTAITVTGSNYGNYQKVGSKNTSKRLVDARIREFPVSGKNQVWDLRTYASSSAATSESRTNLPVPDSTSFTSATFVVTQQSTFISDFTYTEFYEVSDNGYYKIGDKVHAGSADLGNGTTLTAAGTEVALNPQDLIFKFPMNYDDVTEQEGIQIEGYSLTAPAFGLSNAPVERKITYPKKSEVVGWGKVILPQGAIADTTEVLLVKNTSTIITNYFLNGSTAPDALLSALNLTEGGKSTTIFYYFISKEFGVIASMTFATDTNGNATFPATFARYVETKE